MAFSLNVWKYETAKLWQAIAPRVEYAAAHTLYGLLAGSALLPLFSAAAQGELMPAILTLSSIAGGVGGNLVASQVQKWQDRVSEPDVLSALAQEINQQCEQYPELRNTIDAILKELDVTSAVHSALSIEDKEWFTRILQEELDNLYDAEPQMVFNIGGATAVDGGTAVNQGVLVQGNVTGNVYGFGSTHEVHHHGLDADENAKFSYLRGLRHRCNSLPLSAMGGDENQDLHLEDVYVSLNTETRITLSSDVVRPLRNRVPKTRQLSALEAVSRYRRLTLLGDPGSGKSSFVCTLVAHTAYAAEFSKATLASLPKDTFPILVVLRDLASQLEKVPENVGRTAKHKSLLGCLENYLQTQLKDFRAGSFLDELLRLMQKGTVLLVLDGMDELRDILRLKVHDLIAAVLETYPEIHTVIVTCRQRSYQPPLANFDAEVLSPFDQNQIKNFVEQWYQALARKGRYTGAQAVERSKNLVAGTLSPALRELASNPMLLTTMAIMHQRETRLPPERVKLYELAVETLLRRWHQHKDVEVAPDVYELLHNELKLYEVVERLGYEAHQQQSIGKSQGDLRRGDLLELLSAKASLGTAALADFFLDYIDNRAGLLVGRGGTEQEEHPRLYRFPHRTFQEYLAGCFIMRGRTRDRIKLIGKLAREGDFWQNAVQLGTESLYYGRNGQETDVIDLAYELAPPADPQGSPALRQTLWAAQMVALVGIDRIKEDSRDRDPSYLERLRDRVVKIIQGRTLPTPERFAASRLLSQITDPRFDIKYWYLPKDPQLGFVEIPETNTKLGSHIEVDEYPPYSIALPTYWIGRYPVTVAQWKAYLKSTGRAPIDPNSIEGPDDHPVVFVSWYEASEYALWLDGELQRIARLGTFHQKRNQRDSAFWVDLARGKVWVCLPSEAQWERAARPKDGREYPWGNRITREHANFAATQLRGTSPVGMFSRGRTSDGVDDLSGNVWEWTKSLYMNYPYLSDDGREDLSAIGDRVIRGGSFKTSARYLRSALRHWCSPHFTSEEVGFRVCISVRSAQHSTLAP